MSKATKNKNPVLEFHDTFTIYKTEKSIRDKDGKKHDKGDIYNKRILDTFKTSDYEIFYEKEPNVNKLTGKQMVSRYAKTQSRAKPTNDAGMPNMTRMILTSEEYDAKNPDHKNAPIKVRGIKGSKTRTSRRRSSRSSSRRRSSRKSSRKSSKKRTSRRRNSSKKSSPRRSSRKSSSRRSSSRRNSSRRNSSKKRSSSRRSSSRKTSPKKPVRRTSKSITRSVSPSSKKRTSRTKEIIEGFKGSCKL